jgi:nuclear transport factor 2 (NTF2) superfamily protein
MPRLRTATTVENYEWYNKYARPLRTYGNEDWAYGEAGLMRRRIASINEGPIHEKAHALREAVGHGPDGHPRLGDLGL